MIVVEERELRAALKLDIAAARIAAMTNPAAPTGNCFQMKSG